MKKINKLIMTIGAGAASIIAPLSVVSMKANTEAKKSYLFDNVFAKKYTLKSNWTDNEDVVNLFYENKNEIYHLKDFFNIKKFENDITPENVKDYKITILGIETKPYDPDVHNPELLRIAFDVEDLNSKKHWGFTINSTDPRYYQKDSSAYSKLFKYLSYKTRMESEWYKSIADDNPVKRSYIAKAKEFLDGFSKLFFSNETNIFKNIKSLLINVQNGKEKLSDKLKEYNIEKNLDLFQFFNQDNILDFSVGQKKVIDQNSFFYNTRIKGLINPLDILKNKIIYKNYIEEKLKQNNTIIDLKNNIDVKIKKVIVLPEFQLDGNWDINYNSELSGSLLGQSIIIPNKKIGILDKTKVSHNQDIFTYLERAGELINIKANRNNLFPLKNDYKNYETLQNSITQKSMKELFKRSTFSIEPNYDITNLKKDLTLDLSMKNLISHDKNKRFNITIKGLSVGFQYQATINDDLEIPGVTYLLK